MRILLEKAYDYWFGTAILKSDELSDYKLLKQEKVLSSQERISVIASQEGQIQKDSRWWVDSLGLIGRLPHFARGETLANVKKANRYLALQEKRIVSHISKGNLEAAFLIWMMVLKTSTSYQTVLFNRVCKGWYYKWEKKVTDRILMKAINKIRQFDMTLLINRFYIIKNRNDSERNGKLFEGELLPGEKLRPIGAPNFESRMISKALTDVMYAFTESSRSTEQHGYMRNRGTWSACLQVVDHLKRGYSGYEFDLVSFFNQITPYIVHKKLEACHPPLRKLIGKILRKIEYRWEDLQKEAELQQNSSGRVTRWGLPQGLSMSPLLATLCLEAFGRPNHMVMYADDGIFFYKGENGKKEFEEWIQRIQGYGVILSPEKSHDIDAKHFKFCGVDFYPAENTLGFQGRLISWHDKNLEKWLKGVAQFYGKQPKSWEWKIAKNAYIRDYKLDLTEFEKVLVYARGWLWNNLWKGYRAFKGSKEVWDVTASSSWCCNELLETLKLGKPKLAKIKAFSGIFDTEDCEYDHLMDKGIYKQYLNNKKRRGSAKKHGYSELRWWNPLAHLPMSERLTEYVIANKEFTRGKVKKEWDNQLTARYEMYMADKLPDPMMDVKDILAIYGNAVTKAEELEFPDIISKVKIRRRKM